MGPMYHTILFNMGLLCLTIICFKHIVHNHLSYEPNSFQWTHCGYVFVMRVTLVQISQATHEKKSRSKENITSGKTQASSIKEWL